jgi:anti-sigma regulatory factor (Ser/Thr protein kinase)
VRELRLAPLPGASAAARRLVTRACTDWELPDLVADAALVASELVANAVEHACTEVLVLIRRESGGVRIEVCDDDSGMPCMPEHDGVLHRRGRGMRLVETVSRSWGAEPTATGKVVWATLRRP